MKKAAVIIIAVCLLASGCGNGRIAEPIYSQDETLVQGTSDEETSLAPHTGALASAQLAELDTKQVTWGPGREMDEQNRPSACVSLQEQYGKYDAVFLSDQEGICLTFDEGYENGYTASILDTLKEQGVSAIFFVTLDYVKKEPDLVRRMIDEGHTVGNHTAYHPNMTKITLEKAQENIQVLHDYVQDEFQYTMTLFRNPEGAFSEQVLALTQSMGYKTVLWSFAYKDWDVKQQMDADTALKNVTKGLHPGAVYLLHAVSSTNDQILKSFIEQTRAAGYDFVQLQ